MRALRLRQCLGVATALILTVLIVGATELGLAIQHDDKMLPQLNVSLNRLQIIAYTTDPIDCRPERPCYASSRYYAVLWVIHTPASDSVHETWHTLLRLPLQH